MFDQVIYSGIPVYRGHQADCSPVRDKIYRLNCDFHGKHYF